MGEGAEWEGREVSQNACQEKYTIYNPIII